jgi:6-phosphogluconolactonase
VDGVGTEKVRMGNMQKERVIQLGRRSGLAAVLAVTGLAVTSPSALAGGGRVYVATNAAKNSVVVFRRAENGRLTRIRTVRTGGRGQPANNPPLGIPFLDTASSMGLSKNGRLLFVVNAGDNTVTSFRVTVRGLRLADRQWTHGIRPISLTSDRNRLFILNADVGQARITGFHFSRSGVLTHINRSTRSVTTPTSLPPQIAFSTDGRVLVVTERNPTGVGDINTFVLGRGDVPRRPVAHPSNGITPYGIAFDRHSHMIITNEDFTSPFDSTVSSYSVGPFGAIHPLDIDTTNSGAACWNVITKDGRYVFITSPFSSSIEAFRIHHNGTLAPVTPDSHVGAGTGATLDEGLSRDSRYLYVLDSNGPFVRDTIDAFRVKANGTLTRVGSFGSLPGSSSGLASR